MVSGGKAREEMEVFTELRSASLPAPIFPLVTGLEHTGGNTDPCAIRYKALAIFLASPSS